MVLGAAAPETPWAVLHVSWTEWKNLFSLEIFCREAKLQVDGLVRSKERCEGEVRRANEHDRARRGADQDELGMERGRWEVRSGGEEALAGQPVRLVTQVLAHPGEVMDHHTPGHGPVPPGMAT